MRQPLYCTAVGKAILAELTDHDILSVWEKSEIIPLTPNTMINRDIFMNEINRIRHIGYAIDHEENELGVRCVAVAFRDYTGHACHAISVSAPASRMTDEKITDISSLLIQARSELER